MQPSSDDSRIERSSVARLASIEKRRMSPSPFLTNFKMEPLFYHPGVATGTVLLAQVDLAGAEHADGIAVLGLVLLLIGEVEPGYISYIVPDMEVVVCYLQGGILDRLLLAVGPLDMDENLFLP